VNAIMMMNKKVKNSRRPSLTYRERRVKIKLQRNKRKSYEEAEEEKKVVKKAKCIENVFC